VIRLMVLVAVLGLPFAASSLAAPAPESIQLSWVGERDGRVLRLFESDPVAVVRVVDPTAVRVEALVGALRVGRQTVARAGDAILLPVAVPRVRAGASLTLTVRATGADGTATERSFGPVVVGRPVPRAVAGLGWRWGSPTRVRLDWRLGPGDTDVAQFVVRRGARILARLPEDVRLYRVTSPCSTAQTYSVASVSADGLEGSPSVLVVPARSCPAR
jgi:hypothetical protein